MEKTLGWFSPLVLCIVLNGCYSDIDLGGYKNGEIEERIVLNCIVSPDSAVKAVASHPYIFSEQHTKPVYETGLVMQLIVNGKSMGFMEYSKADSCYHSPYKPKEGDILKLSAVSHGKTVVAVDTVPRKVAIESLIVFTDDSGSNYKRVNYEITFSDPAGKENYYFLYFDGKETDRFYNEGDKDYSNEFVFQVLAEIINSRIPGWKPFSLMGLPFSDKGIDGTRHTIHVSDMLRLYEGPDSLKGKKRKVSLYSISKAYYEYMKSILVNDPDDDSLHAGFIGLGLLEPEGIYSNVDGGAGIFGSYVYDSVSVSISQR